MRGTSPSPQDRGPPLEISAAIDPYVALSGREILQGDNSGVLRLPRVSARGVCNNLDANLSLVYCSSDQDRVIAEQDEQLAELEGTVHSLNDMSNAMSEEISLHNDMLDDLNARASNVQGSVTHNRRRLSEVLTRHNNCGLWCLIILLVVTLVSLLTITK
ncbi:hypothetical protein FOZ63_004633 [Perkinsus olseni]|uniref:t-SNARE coiled-coil homology domain-containing protein n=1 Tax=Perkinsus olseni TaxID=32597 RepID=A0A7J6TD95_PEROL|nr:hypothetical protein FOZ63_004633 [Perkinsus olseni]